MSKNYVGVNDFKYPIVDNPLAGEDDSNKIKQSKDCLYDNLIYALRHTKTGEQLHTNKFECLDKGMLKELKGIEKLIEYDRQNALFDNRPHLINDVLIPYGFFLKVYAILKKIRFLNPGDQEKLKRKAEWTLCVLNQFNGLYTIRAMNQDSRRKNYIPVYIFIDCAFSVKHYNNYYFSTNPKCAFIVHYHEEGKNTRSKESFQCHYWNTFF